MHYKFSIRLLQNNPYLASTVGMKNLISPVCQRFYRTHALAVNKKIPFHSSVMFCSLPGVGVREKKAAIGTMSNMSSSHNLSALLCKQTFYMNMIDSLEPTGDFDPNEAKVRSEHLKQFYEEFISNQSEIVALGENASFDDQVEISQEVEQKVCQIQAKLEKIISPIKTVQTSASSVINDHANQTEHLHVISDFLDSFVQKASSLQIKLKKMLAPVTSSIPEDVSAGAVKARIRSSETISSVPEGVSSDDVDAEFKSLGSRSCLNNTLEVLQNMEDKIYKEILGNISYSPKVAGSNHLRPLVDKEYEWFVRIREGLENDAREFPEILNKLKEMSERVERAVKDYGLYCEGRIPKAHFDYLSSNEKAVR